MEGEEDICPRSAGMKRLRSPWEDGEELRRSWKEEEEEEEEEAEEEERQQR